jgi:D-alanyl-D-alanine carboxypeptidase
MADRMIPGGLVLLHGPQVEYLAAYGTTELGADTAPTADTHVRIASISKSMTAASILLLAQDRELSLADPISKYVPEVPGGDTITIAQLLEMRSGLYNYTDDPALSGGIDADHQRMWTPQELLAIAFSHPPNFAPDADYEYSNTNYALLGLVAERADGKPLATVLQDRVFGPVGMTNSFLPPPDSVVLPDPFSHGYLYGSSSHVFGDEFPYTREEQAAAHVGTLPPIEYTDVNHTFAFGTGGVISTANDLATFFKAYVGGGLLDPDVPGSADQQPAAGTCGQARAVPRVRLERAPVGRPFDRVPRGRRPASICSPAMTAPTSSRSWSGRISRLESMTVGRTPTR